ncbi:MAG: alkyl hydroperoxide reductase subunit F [Deltaproteobacteria bacterium]|nr:alkyl hydroperoxide reductase subunit F [Deltaproteobacteria bacterium]
MLDDGIKEQLAEVLGRLEEEVALRVPESAHSEHGELLAMLHDVASTSAKVRVDQITGGGTDAPVVVLHGPASNGAIRFRGVPGGHEFSSLILGILCAGGKGRLPDPGILGRIRALKGPIRLRTYVSLSCENCPDVVQALNLMATVHPDFHHETVDGAVARSEVEALAIQGVPSVIHQDTLLHAGKASLAELLAVMERSFGTTAGPAAADLGLFDVVVVGGGPAGASSAIYSSRKGLRTAMVAERLGGQLRETRGIENMISVAYTEGAQLAAQLSEHVARYPVEVFEHRRVSRITGDTEKRIELESGETLRARTVIVATGARWRQLGIPGEQEYIGRGVAFCAHCDGPFYKGKNVVVVGGGNSGVEAAVDLAGIAREVTLVEFAGQLRADSVLVQKLTELPNTRIITHARSTQVLGDGKQVVGLEYEDRQTSVRTTLAADGVFVQIGLLPNSQFLKDDVQLAPTGEIMVDGCGRTSVPGIYAAGDVTTIPFKQIVMAMGDGARAALGAFEDRLRATP